MIIGDLRESSRYHGLHPRMKELFDYVAQHDFSALPPGRITIDGDRLFINLDEADLMPKERQRLEVHRRYIDVQIPLDREEGFGWSPLSSLGSPDTAFDPLHDCGFYCRPASAYLTVCPGQFVVCFPEDAHAPLIGTGRQRKLVGKILI